MEIALQKDYNIKSSLRKKYSDMLVSRAVRFYIETNLDKSVVEEDLYNYEDFDCSCTQEDADRNKHQLRCDAISDPYPNLSYSIEHEKEWQNNFKG